MKAINVGLIGCGTVGTGVAKILLENQDIIKSKLGASVILRRIADIDITRDRGIKFDEGVLINDANQITDDPQIDIVIETVGGETFAKTFILRAIENGKHIITANKALIANHIQELFNKAFQKGVDFAYEASVCGCIPIIKTLRESLAANKIYSMVGILNGTCNYILSKITDNGHTFENALKEAQANGFAEADPTLDIEGFDTAHKLAILMSIAYGTYVDLKDIYIEGISNISPLDINYAKQFGYKIKLLAISKKTNNGIEARVHPAMIPFDNMLSNVNGSLNAVTITGDAVGDMMLYGKGAGMMPTASAVMSDLIDISRNILSDSCGRIPLLSYQMKNINKIPILSLEEISTQYYFRFSVLDKPGVLSKIAGILGDNNISIKSVNQKARKSRGPVPIVMLTHKAKEADVKNALKSISLFDFTYAQPILIRIEEDDE